MTIQQINNSLRVLWEFNFHNLNRETKERGPMQSIIVAVRAISKDNYRGTDLMKADAVRKFTAIVSVMYPKADQIVSDYGLYEKKRIFV